VYGAAFQRSGGAVIVYRCRRGSSLNVTIRLLEGGPSVMRELQRVFEDAPTYAHRITRALPGPADAQSTYTALPEGKCYDDKFVFGIYLAGEMLGVQI